jgi:methylenetetrahydrofolate reductase (NADPH)
MIVQKPIANLFRHQTHVSFEVFPPKTSQGIKQIYQTIAHLKGMSPDFFSVTYGAGGTTSEKSLEIESALVNLARVNCVAHLTCVGMNREQMGETLKALAFHGIANVLALRGDPPAGSRQFVKPENGFAYAAELVRFIREESSMGVLVAGYPEGHKENPSREDDFRHLVEKIRSGADAVVTQLFFENDHLFALADRLLGVGIDVPLLAGIFPISNASQIERLTELSGATIPSRLREGLDRYGNSPEDMERFGTDYAVEQVTRLLEGGVTAFHFYTMNRHRQTRQILEQLRDSFPRLNFE